MQQTFVRPACPKIVEAGLSYRLIRRAPIRVEVNIEVYVHESVLSPACDGCALEKLLLCLHIKVIRMGVRIVNVPLVKLGCGVSRIFPTQYVDNDNRLAVGGSDRCWQCAKKVLERTEGVRRIDFSSSGEIRCVPQLD